jgi:hypothetical protein
MPMLPHFSKWRLISRARGVGTFIISPLKLFALMLSLAAHLVIVFLFGVHHGPYYGTELALPTRPVLTISLEKEGGAGDSSDLKPSKSGGMEEPLDDYFPGFRPFTKTLAGQTPILPVPGKIEPRYFRTSELTEKPRVMHDNSHDEHDDSSDMELTLPGVPPQSATLRLFINENGETDRVVIEGSRLPSDAARLVIAAFSKLRFHPGIVADTPVKSQLRIEVMLADTPLPLQ